MGLRRTHTEKLTHFLSVILPARQDTSHIRSLFRKHRLCDLMGTRTYSKMEIDTMEQVSVVRSCGQHAASVLSFAGTRAEIPNLTPTLSLLAPKLSPAGVLQLGGNSNSHPDFKSAILNTSNDNWCSPKKSSGGLGNLRLSGPEQISPPTVRTAKSFSKPNTQLLVRKLVKIPFLACVARLKTDTRAPSACWTGRSFVFWFVGSCGADKL